MWDIRFQKMVKLWRLNNPKPINRLATSYATTPSAIMTNSGPRPLLFVANGNECGMFDVTDGSCPQDFRVLAPTEGRGLSTSKMALPFLTEVNLSTTQKLSKVLRAQGMSPTQDDDKLGRIGSCINAMVGSMGGYDHNYLITAGSDAYIRYWDFANPAKCSTVSGQVGTQQRPTFERVDFQMSTRMMICRQHEGPRLSELESSRVPRRLYRGLTRPENRHQDGILDLKLIQKPKALISASRDGSIKIWK